jgi:hypothetical protein
MMRQSLQIKTSSLGGYAVVSTFERRARVLAAIRRAFDWVVIA